MTQEKTALTLGQLAAISTIPTAAVGGAAGYRKGGVEGAVRGAAGAGLGGVGGAMTETALPIATIHLGALAGYKAL